MKHELQVRVRARIVRAREEAKLSQRQLGELTGNPTRTVQTWESKAAPQVPRLETLAKIAEVTGRPVSWFYADEDDDPKAQAA